MDKFITKSTTDIVKAMLKSFQLRQLILVLPLLCQKKKKKKRSFSLLHSLPPPISVFICLCEKMDLLNSSLYEIFALRFSFIIVTFFAIQVKLFMFYKKKKKVKIVYASSVY